MRSAPSILTMVTIWLIASVALTIMGPFGTIAIPVSVRLPYWLGLMAVSCIKWWSWYRVTGPLVQWRERDMTLLGFLSIFVLHLTLPLEVRLANHLIDAPAPKYLPLYGTAVALGVTICISVELVRGLIRRNQPDPVPVPTTGRDTLPVDEPQEDVAPTAAVGGLLVRAGVAAPELLLAVEAEDHYLRLHLADGRKPLVLYRLRDALAELSHLDGEQVHRGHWVASRAVQGLERREGKKWALRLDQGLLIPVSATYLPTVRRRGWRELAT